MNSNKLKDIFTELNEWTEKLKLISRLELRNKIKKLLEKYNINPNEMIEDSGIGRPISMVQYIFNSITTTPISIDSPLLGEKLNYENVYFYYSHTQHDIEDLIGDSFQRYSSFVLKNMKKKIKKIYQNANYKLEETDNTKFKALLNGKTEIIILYPTASLFYKDLKAGKQFNHNTIIIPQGATPAPYYKIYMEYSDELEDNHNVVLLINFEENYITPFIGIPEDKKIVHQLIPDKNIIRAKRAWQRLSSFNFE
ncbi:MAG: DUF6834 family protein [Candidatus Helarchaeota archaeon]